MKTNLYGIDNRGVYFQQTKSGNWTIVRDDGTKKTLRKCPDFLEGESDWTISDWKRATLYARECGIWDITAFGCTMTTFILFPIEGDRGITGYLMFSSCESAEKKIFPFLTRKEVEMSQIFVRQFYETPDLQKKWEGVILHPACFFVHLHDRILEPISFDQINEEDIIILLILPIQVKAGMR